MVGEATSKKIEGYEVAGY